MMKRIIYPLILILIVSVSLGWNDNDIHLFWELGNGENVTEATGKGWDGVVTGSISPVPNSSGHPNSALRFDADPVEGTNKLNFGDIADLDDFLTTNMTLCFQANFSGSGIVAEFLLKNQPAGRFHDIGLIGNVGGGSDNIGAEYDDGVNPLQLYHTMTVQDNQWHSHCLVADINSGAIQWYNETLQGPSSTNWDGLSGGTADFILQNPREALTLDRVVFFNKTLNVTELGHYMNGTQAIFQGEPLVEILFYSRQGTFITGDFEEDEEFYIFANYSLGGSPAQAVNCNGTENNITAHFARISATNETLNNIDNTINLTNKHVLVGDQKEDIIEFEVCEEGPPVNLDIYVDGVLHEAINHLEIPVCPAMLTYFNVTKQYLGDNDLNITLECGNCNAIRQLRIPIDSDNENLHFERTFNEGHFQASFPYNATSKLHEYRNHWHEYFLSGATASLINVSCDSTLNASVNGITEGIPFIEITTINDVTYTDGLQVEAINQTNITINAGGDVITRTSFNVTYENGTVIKEVVDTFGMTLSLSELDHNGLYNISINVTDNDDTSSNLSGFFRFNDTIGPSISWVNPVDDNSTVVIVDQNFQLEATVLDNVSVWGYWVTVTAPGSSYTIKYNATGLNDPVASIFEVFNANLTGTWLVNITANDTFDGSYYMVTELVEFTVATTAPVNATLPFNECPDNIPGSMALWTVVFIILFFIFIAFMYRLTAIGILASVGLIVLALTISGCSQLVALVIGGIGALLSIAFVVR